MEWKIHFVRTLRYIFSSVSFNLQADFIAKFIFFSCVQIGCYGSSNGFLYIYEFVYSNFSLCLFLHKNNSLFLLYRFYILKI